MPNILPEGPDLDSEWRKKIATKQAKLKKLKQFNARTSIAPNDPLFRQTDVFQSSYLGRKHKRNAKQPHQNSMDQESSKRWLTTQRASFVEDFDKFSVRQEMENGSSPGKDKNLTSKRPPRDTSQRLNLSAQRPASAPSKGSSANSLKASSLLQSGNIGTQKEEASTSTPHQNQLVKDQQRSTSADAQPGQQTHQQQQALRQFLFRSSYQATFLDDFDRQTLHQQANIITTTRASPEATQLVAQKSFYNGYGEP
jgi:hypothetical protein